MKFQNFFDNLNVYFQDEEAIDAQIVAFVYKNDEGIINEVRIFNPEHEEILVINRDKTIEALNIEEYNETQKK